MATLREITYNIKNVAEGGSSIPQDSKFSDLQVEFFIHTYRAQMLLRYTNSGRAMHAQSQQTLKHTSTTDGNPYIAFPAIINFSRNKAVSRIRLWDNSASKFINIQLTHSSISEYSSGNKFTGSSKKAHIKEGRLYFVNFTMDTDDFIEVTAAFANPTEITTNAGAFDRDTSIYPMPTELIPALTLEILQKEYNIGTQQPRDKNVDGETPREEVQGQVRKR